LSSNSHFLDHPALDHLVGLDADVEHEALPALHVLLDVQGEGRQRRSTAVAEPPLEEAVHVLIW